VRRGRPSWRATGYPAAAAPTVFSVRKMPPKGHDLGLFPHFRDGQDRDEAAAESCADGMLALRRARTSEDYDQAAGALDLGP
jgi:hypothetical protein